MVFHNRLTGDIHILTKAAIDRGQNLKLGRHKRGVLYCNITNKPRVYLKWTAFDSDCQLKFGKGWSPPGMMCNQWPITLSLQHVDIVTGGWLTTVFTEDVEDAVPSRLVRTLCSGWLVDMTTAKTTSWDGKRKWWEGGWTSHDMQRKGFRD